MMMMTTLLLFFIIVIIIVIIIFINLLTYNAQFRWRNVQLRFVLCSMQHLTT